jgi:hypothetical protein
MATKAKQPAKKAAAKKPVAKKPTAKQDAPSQRTGGGVAMSVPTQNDTPPKPPSNFCDIHGRLLRANRTCPVTGCRHHTKPMPG